MSTINKTKSGTVTRSVSLPVEAATGAEMRSKEDQRTFSGYIAKLIADDLKRAGVTASKQRPAKSLQPA